MSLTLCSLLALTLAASPASPASPGTPDAPPRSDDGMASLTAKSGLGEKCAWSNDCGDGLRCASGFCRYACSEDSACRSGRCLPAGDGETACTEEVTVRPPPVKHPAATWSKQGWDAFRFGMGPGDVLLAAGPGASFDRLDMPSNPPEVEAQVLEGWATPVIDGKTMDPRFEFLRGRLYQITLSPDWPDDAYNDKRSAFFFYLEGQLTAKYGSPTRRDVPGKATIGDVSSGRRSLAVTWSKKGIEISLAAFGISDGDIAVTLTYADPKVRAQALELWGNKAVDAYRQERERL